MQPGEWDLAKQKRLTGAFEVREELWFGVRTGIVPLSDFQKATRILNFTIALNWPSRD